MHLVGALVVEVERVEPLRIQAEEFLHALPEGGKVPLVGIDVAAAERLDGFVN